MIANLAWVRLLSQVLQWGSDYHIRDKECREFICYTSMVYMTHPVITIKARKISYKHMVNEALWMLDGANDLTTISRFAPSYSRFSDDGMSLYGAYGVKFIPQLAYVVKALLADTYTRQAVMTFWKENPRKSLDIPCTVSLQFVIRKNKIHCIAFMRSSDCWLGWPYDVFTFSMMTATVALEMFAQSGVLYELGSLYLTAGSQHIYKADEEKVKSVLTHCKENWEFHDMQLHGLNNPVHLRDTLRDIIECRGDKNQWPQLFKLTNPFGKSAKLP